MKLFIALTLFFSCSLIANDICGSWSKELIIECNWEFISSQREEMRERAKRVYEEIGEQAPLRFFYDKDMSDKEKKRHEAFLAAKLSQKQTDDHLRNLLANLERNRKALALLEEKAEKSWEKNKGQRKDFSKREEREAEIYGSKIKAENLGVVLDNSASMSPFLPKLTEEIKKNFPNAKILTVYGSLIQEYQELRKPVDLHWFFMDPIEGENPFQKKWFCQSIPQAKAHYSYVLWERSVVSAMETLAYHHKVDAIYWFSDIKDRPPRSLFASGMKKLEEMVSSTGVKIYLQTTGKTPTNTLKSFIKKSGGEVNRKKIR